MFFKGCHQESKKKNHRMVENLQIIYLLRDLPLEYIKNYCTSITKNTNNTIILNGEKI